MPAPRTPAPDPSPGATVATSAPCTDTLDLLRDLPDTPATRALWAALAANPGTTTAALAEGARIGRSTTTKLLAALAEAGAVRREPGGRVGGTRQPDRWTIITAEAPTPTQQPSDVTEARGGARLGNGLLREMVLAHLQANPGREFTTTGIARALDRSAGAISNACQRLLTDGAVIQTSERPRRYQTTGIH